MLPSKTIPEANNGKKQTRKPKPKPTTTAPPKKKARARSVEVEEIEDEDSSRNSAARNNGISLTSSFEIPNIKKVNLFFNIVDAFSLMFSERPKC